MRGGFHFTLGSKSFFFFLPENFFLDQQSPHKANPANPPPSETLEALANGHHRLGKGLRGKCCTNFDLEECKKALDWWTWPTLSSVEQNFAFKDVHCFWSGTKNTVTLVKELSQILLAAFKKYKNSTNCRLAQLHRHCYICTYTLSYNQTTFKLVCLINGLLFSLILI